MMVSKKLDIIMDAVNGLTENLNTLTRMVEGIMFKILTSNKLTKEEKEQLLKEMKSISSKESNKTIDPFTYGTYNEYLGK